MILVLGSSFRVNIIVVLKQFVPKRRPDYSEISGIHWDLNCAGVRALGPCFGHFTSVYYQWLRSTRRLRSGFAIIILFWKGDRAIRPVFIPSLFHTGILLILVIKFFMFKSRLLIKPYIFVSCKPDCVTRRNKIA